MAENKPQAQYIDGADTAEFLLDVMERFKSGELTAITLRLKHTDGTVEDLAIGYDTDEERDAALARMLKVLGELH
jgi:hypothetical protein